MASGGALSTTAPSADGLQANSGSSAFRWVGILVVITAAILALTAQAHHNRRMMMRLDYALALVERSHNLSNSTNANIGVDKWELPGEGGQPAGKEEQQAVAEAGPLGCRASGYCSLGKSKVWRGDIATNAALLEMLQAVAYKKEVIFSVSNLVGQQVELVLNVIKSAEAMGYGHSLILSYKPEGCDLIASISSTTSCVWDSRHIVNTSELFDIYTRRWDLFARIARMGYNVLSVDGDTVIASDFYSFVKSPPFSNYTFLTQDDGGGVNCGVVYIQNAHPSGPAVWMAVEHSYRTARQRENMTHMQEMYTNWENGDTWEQPYWNQVLSSVTTGRPYHSFGKDKDHDEWKAELRGHFFHARLLFNNVTWPPAWRNQTGADVTEMRSVENLALPVVSDDWWAKFSKYIYPPNPGNVSKAFIELIRTGADNPFFEIGKPCEPINIPPEHFAFFPCWFSCAYAFRGLLGYWNVKPPAAVVMHDVWLPHAGWKPYAFKGAGMFHWEVMEAARKSSNVLGLADPKLLMLAPGVQLFADTEQNFLEAAKQLLRLASMMGRQLVFPNPPCDSMWIGIFASKDYPHPYLDLWPFGYDGFQVLQLTDTMRPSPERHLYCHWLHSLETDQCRAAAPPHADAVGFLERWPNREQAEPSKRNTLYFAEWQAAGGAAGPAPAPPAAITTPRPEVEAADAAVVVTASAAFADWPVLFLGAIPKLGSNDTLEPIQPVLKDCKLFADEPFTFKPSRSVGNRIPWLDGTLTR